MSFMRNHERVSKNWKNDISITLLKNWESCRLIPFNIIHRIHFYSSKKSQPRTINDLVKCFYLHRFKVKFSHFSFCILSFNMFFSSFFFFIHYFSFQFTSDQFFILFHPIHANFFPHFIVVKLAQRCVRFLNKKFFGSCQALYARIFFSSFIVLQFIHVDYRPIMHTQSRANTYEKLIFAIEKGVNWNHLPLLTFYDSRYSILQEKTDNYSLFKFKTIGTRSTIESRPLYLQLD